MERAARGERSRWRAALRKRVVDGVLGAPERSGTTRLETILRLGGSSQRIRAARQLAVREAPAAKLYSLLLDTTPGVRRAAAWGLGLQSDRRHVEILLTAASRERCDAVRLALGVGAVRCGARPSAAWAALERASLRRFASWSGPKGVGEVAGAGRDAIARLWTLTLDPTSAVSDPGDIVAQPAPRLRALLLERLDADPEDRDATEALGAQQHPDDFERLTSRLEAGGRRESHTTSRALGLHGDPRSLGALRRRLAAVDTDPGHGFAGRRAAAEALGRLGDPSAGPALVSALEVEALEHEGRPGAGLGIQFPVRMSLLSALGECGARGAAPTLARYLGNTHGSAMGGFYLPAMDALWKLGEPTPVVALLGADEVIAANAVGVLGAMGQLDAVRACLGDHRAIVARAAADALQLVDSAARQFDDDVVAVPT